MSGLAGRTVVVTRPPEQAAAFADALRARGARVVLLPTITMRPADDPAPLDRAVDDLAAYAWVVFTSANAVRFLWDRLAARGRDGLPAELQVAAVGRATGRALAERGVTVGAMPEQFLGARIAEALGDLRGARVLLPRADIGRAATVEALEAAGAAVDAVTAYHTIPAALDPDALREAGAGADAFTFTSPSTFDNLLVLAAGRAPSLLDGTVIASIGPVTSGAIRAAGYPVHVEASEHTTDGLAADLDTYFARHAAGVAGETS